MEDEEGHIRLCWDQFQTNLKKSFQNVRSSQDFCDVTLVSEDGDMVEAHRVILTASSKLFQNILSTPTTVRHPRPLIYLSGVKSDYLNFVLDFLYCGEVSVDQENLSLFFEVAKILQIKGLVEKEKSRNSEKQINEHTMNLKEEKYMNTGNCELEEADTERFEQIIHNTRDEVVKSAISLSFTSGEITEMVGDGVFSETNNGMSCKVCDYVAVNKYEIKKHIESHLTKFEDLNNKTKQRSEVWEFAKKLSPDTATCTLCDKLLSCKSGTTSSIQNHLAGVHGKAIIGFKTEQSKIKLKVNSPFWNYATKRDGRATCNLCKKTLAASTSSIKNHLKSKHKNEFTEYNLALDEHPEINDINLE